MSRHYDADGLCRYCRRYDGEHKASCVLAPEPELVYAPLVDAEALDRAEDRYLRALIGEDR